MQQWGEPRLTRDLDLSLLTGFGEEEPYISRLLEKFEPRIPDAMQFALTRRVLLLEAESGTGIDVALAALPFEERVMKRAVDVFYTEKQNGSWGEAKEIRFAAGYKSSGSAIYPTVAPICPSNGASTLCQSTWLAIV